MHERIAALSAGRAAIVGGDFNSSYGDMSSTAVPVPGATGADYATLQQEFVQPLGLSDSGAHPVDLDTRHQRDYLFYRSGGSVEVQVESGAGEDSCLRGFSDHRAIQATFR